MRQNLAEARFCLASLKRFLAELRVRYECGMQTIPNEASELQRMERLVADC